jgi:hypothetical protein
MSSDSENESIEMADPRPTPDPENPTQKLTIFHSNTSNPDFVPGYSVLRLEQVKHLSNEKDKTRLMNSIVDDIVATITSIHEYHQNGILSDDNIFQVSTMIQNIGYNNLKMQDRLEDKTASLKRQRCQRRRDYQELVQQMDVMGQKYALKVTVLEDRVKVLKKRVAWVEAGGPLRQVGSRLDERVDRCCVEEESGKNEDCDDEEQMFQDDDNAGEWEEDSI